MSRTSIRNEIRNAMRRLREQAKQENEKTLDLVQLQNVVFTEERKGYVDGRFVDRFVFFLRGTGCSWVTQCGGCTFCGFWDATNFGERIADVNYMAQVQNVLADPALDLEQYPILCLYNDGSLLVEEEIGLEVVLEILGPAEPPTARPAPGARGQDHRHHGSEGRGAAGPDERQGARDPRRLRIGGRGGA